eukprot:scaffold385_cov305-Pinguiococcus_pyrenoidosus.AAC.47
MSFESEVGAQPPLGFWDPLGLLADADQERFDRLRYVEVRSSAAWEVEILADFRPFVQIKHGRISMLAILGHLVTTAGARLPGNIDFQGALAVLLRRGAPSADEARRFPLLRNCFL